VLFIQRHHLLLQWLWEVLKFLRRDLSIPNLYQVGRHWAQDLRQLLDHLTLLLFVPTESCLNLLLARSSEQMLQF